MKFPRKESRPRSPFLVSGRYRPDPETAFRTGRRIWPGGACGGSCKGDRGGGKAPFISRAWSRTLPIIPLLTLLIISFHLLASPAAAAGEVAPSFAWPAQGEVTASFRSPQGPYGSGGHAGIDISLEKGSEVRASAAGTVTFSGNTPLGLCVSVAHQAGFKSTYVSLQACKVRRGEKVEKGQVVGESDGSKDRSSSSPHLHFGLFLNGQAIDPLPLLEGKLLDPEECLFLGPWEDKEAIRTYLESKGGGGFFDWLGRGFKSVGRTVGEALKSFASAVGKAAAAAWRGMCKAAGYIARLSQAFYRSCLKPWLSPLIRGVTTAARWLWSNRFVQALVAGLAAALIICLAVVGIALALGASLLATVVAAAVGALAALGYALYYAFASGSSFSFTACFLSSLAVGGAAAASSLLLAYLAPLIGAGWSQLGWFGFAKAFFINGGVDSLAYIIFCVASGRKISPQGVLASFLIGGLTGGVGKLVMSGLFAGGAAQVVAAGIVSGGGGILTGEAGTALAAYGVALVTRIAYKSAYVFLCACTGFLADLVIRISTGGMPNLLESLLSFFGGALAGGLSMAFGGEGIGGILTRLSGGRLRITGDLARKILDKVVNGGIKEGLFNLLRRFRRERRSPGKVLWWVERGGEL